LRQFIVVDFEATCWRSRTENKQNRFRSEIIQIGAVKLNENFEEVDQFFEFVRPVLEPTLSDFCQDLTGTSQEDVDHADDFEIVGKQFFDWSRNGGSLIHYFAWGNMDQIFLKYEKRNKDVLHQELEFFRKRWFNLQKIFDTFYIQSKMQYSVNAACEMLKVTPKGIAHNALDDATNTAQIFKALQTKVDWDRVFAQRGSFLE
jgi:inhibitor of KinA sporulation pathway (predicted exonuclease)